MVARYIRQSHSHIVDHKNRQDRYIQIQAHHQGDTNHHFDRRLVGHRRYQQFHNEFLKCGYYKKNTEKSKSGYFTKNGYFTEMWLFEENVHKSRNL